MVCACGARRNLSESDTGWRDGGMSAIKKRYLGNDVYVDYHADLVILTVEANHAITDQIILEPTVARALRAYLSELTPQPDPQTPL